ncbi:MAG TPA: hypothetical protein VHV81_00960 [Steroidobacteraceae bacterium]|jgi:hypothetical protein|nr:hypothetical protein [Steroidobacteraceae bacterium]
MRFVHGLAPALILVVSFPIFARGLSASGGVAAAGGAHGAVAAGAVQGAHGPTASSATHLGSRMPVTQPGPNSKYPFKNTVSKGDGKMTLHDIFPVGGSCSSSAYHRACADLYQLRDRALQLRKADGGRLSAEHDAAIQSEIDRILAQKPT